MSNFLKQLKKANLIANEVKGISEAFTTVMWTIILFIGLVIGIILLVKFFPIVISLSLNSEQKMKLAAKVLELFLNK